MDLQHYWTQRSQHAPIRELAGTVLDAFAPEYVTTWLDVREATLHSWAVGATSPATGGVDHEKLQLLWHATKVYSDFFDRATVQTEVLLNDRNPRRLSLGGMLTSSLEPDAFRIDFLNHVALRLEGRQPRNHTESAAASSLPDSYLEQRPTLRETPTHGYSHETAFNALVARRDILQWIAQQPDVPATRPLFAAAKAAFDEAMNIGRENPTARVDHLHQAARHFEAVADLMGAPVQGPASPPPASRANSIPGTHARTTKGGAGR